MALEWVAAAGFGLVVLLYMVRYMRQQKLFERELLTDMKAKLFPKMVENLRRLVNNLEVEEEHGVIPDSNILEENLSPTLLLHFDLRFSKLRKRMRDVKVNLEAYRQNMEEPSEDGMVSIELKEKLTNMKWEISRELANLIKEIEQLNRLDELPPKKFSLSIET